MTGWLLTHSEMMVLGSWMRLPARSRLTGFRIPAFVFTEMSNALNLSLFWMLTANCGGLFRGPVKEGGVEGQDGEEISATQTFPTGLARPNGSASRAMLVGRNANSIEKKAKYLLK